LINPLIYIIISTIMITSQPIQMEKYSDYIAEQREEYVLDQRDDITSNLIGNTLSNLYNGGLVAEQGDWIYYSNRNDLKTYRIKKDGSEKSIVYDEYMQDLNVVGEWIYGILLFENYDPVVMKIKIDGSNVEFFEYGWGVYITKEGIYYMWSEDLSNKITLYKMDYNTSAIEKVMDFKGDCYMDFIYEDWIYHKDSEYDGEYDRYFDRKTKIDGSETVKLNDKREWIIQYRDKLYYSNENGLYKSNMDGSDKKLISKIKTASKNIYDNVLYYENIEDQKKLYKMSLDTLKSEKISDSKNMDRINIVDGWIYYEIDYVFYRCKLDGSGEEIVK